MDVVLQGSHVVSQKYSDGSTSSAVALKFSNGLDIAIRRVKVSTTARAVLKSVRDEARYQLIKAWKDAAHDLGGKPAACCKDQAETAIAMITDLAMKE